MNARLIQPNFSSAVLKPGQVCLNPMIYHFSAQ